VFECSYQDIYSFSSGALSTSSGSVRFSLSSQSLDHIFATFVENSTPNVPNYTTGTSTFFRRNTGLDRTNAGNLTWQYSVNNVRYPQAPINGAYSFVSLLNTLNLSEAVEGGMNSRLNSMDNWMGHFWVAAQRFVHDSDEAERTVMGVDSRGSVSQMEFLYNGVASPTTKTALVFALTTAVARIGAGRMLDIVK
jgi:hypothetical protein